MTAIPLKPVVSAAGQILYEAVSMKQVIVGNPRNHCTVMMFSRDKNTTTIVQNHISLSAMPGNGMGNT